MKTWQRKSFSGYSEPMPTATYGYWYRLRGQYIAYSGAPIATPILTNPKINPVVKALWRVGYARRFAAWRLAQVDISSGNGRQPKTIFEMSQQVDTPRFTQRPQEPSDWVKTAFPSGVAFMPARPPSTEADITPHLQFAGISGGFAAAVLMMTMSSAVYLSDWPANWYLIAAALSLMIGTIYAWRQWEVSTARARVGWWAMEVARNEDVDGDGFIGEPVARTEPREIPMTSGKTKTQLAVEDESDIDGYSWQSFAVAVMCFNVGISKDKICDATKDPSFPYNKVSQPKYLAIYAMMQKNKYLKGGNELTGLGWEYLSRWVPQSREIKLPYPEGVS